MRGSHGRPILTAASLPQTNYRDGTWHDSLKIYFYSATLPSTLAVRCAAVRALPRIRLVRINFVLAY